MMVRTIAFVVSVLTLAATPLVPVNSGSRLHHEPAGHHWKKLSDRGYFRVYNIDGGASVGLHSRPSLEAPLLKALEQDDIVVSDGVTDWGSPQVWQKVSSAHTDGWVLKRFLKRARPRLLPATNLPIAGSCVGYAPVWSLRWAEKNAFLALFPGQLELAVKAATATEEAKASLLDAASATLKIELLHTGEACARVQGNSSVGVAGYLVVTYTAGKRLLSGCCEAAAEAFDR